MVTPLPPSHILQVFLQTSLNQGYRELVHAHCDLVQSPPQVSEHCVPWASNSLIYISYRLKIYSSYPPPLPIYDIYIYLLPGHSLTLHSSWIDDGPSHSSPPGSADTNCSLVLVLVPPPHVREQTPIFHTSHSQFTNLTTYYCYIITAYFFLLL